MRRDIVAESSRPRDIAWHTTAIERWDNEGGAAAAASTAPNAGPNRLAFAPIALRDGRCVFLTNA